MTRHLVWLPVLFLLVLGCESEGGQGPFGADDVQVTADVACEPSCEGLECGDDGCGGDCGSCTGGEVCRQGLCERVDDICSSLEAIRSYCADRECGTDSCGGICGVCAQGSRCEPLTGVCIEPCTPDCSTRTCGEDPDCPGSPCGACEGELLCQEGLCVQPGPPGVTGHDVGQVMENVNFHDGAGQPVTAHSFYKQGKVIVFAIGAVWCPFCDDEAYFLHEMKDQYGDDLVVLYLQEQDGAGNEISIPAVDEWKRQRPWLNYDVYMNKYGGTANEFWWFFRGLGSFPQSLVATSDDMIVRFKTTGFDERGIQRAIEQNIGAR